MQRYIHRLIRLSVLLAILAGTLGNVAVGAAADSAIDGPTAALIDKAQVEGPLTVMVRLTSVAAQDAVIEEIAGLDASVNVQYDLFPLLSLSAGPDAIAALAASDWVISVAEDIPQPPSLDAALPVINGDDVQTLGWDGSGQTVAILDTGIDVDHPFFAGRIVEQACYSNSAGNAGDSSLCPNGMTVDETVNSANAETPNCLNGTVNLCDHGSHVAGIAAGSTATATGDPGNGVAPGANIIAIQVFTRVTDTDDCDDAPPCVLTYAADQILGLQRVLALDATNTIAAVNMSLGGGNFNANCDVAQAGRKTAVDALLAAGIATVISAGNDAHPAAVGAPGCISTAITVGSTNDDDSISSFSNRGVLLDLFAPGCRIVGSTTEFGMTSAVPDDAFGGKCGTSMAAPMVAGAFAVLREAYPTATIATLLGYMQSTGVDITYTSGGSSVTTQRLDLLAALQAGNNPPSLTVANGTVTVNEGSPAANTGTFSDPESNPITLSASVGTATNTGGGNWSWSFGTDDGPAQSQTVTITATDDKGETGTVSFALTVTNVAPTGDLSDATVAEGSPATLAFSNQADASSADTTAGFRYAFGDCAGGAPSVATYAAASATDDVTCTYGDNGSNPVTGRILDKDNGYTDDIGTVTITNVAPTTSAPTFTVNPVTGVAIAGFSYSDAGWLDTHTASFQWSIDITPRAGTIANAEHAQPDATGTASDIRKLAPGCYTLSVSGTVTDDDGAVSATQSIISSQQVDVYAIRFEAPIKDGERNIAKYGNVVPIKVSVVSSCTGVAVSGLNLHVTYYQGAGDAVDSTPIAVAESVSNADSGSQMRFVDSKYMFNLTTKNMTAGKDHTVQIRLGGNQTIHPEVADAVLHPKK